MSKNTTGIARGGVLAKEQLKMPRVRPLIKIEDAAQGNRAARRAAAKQSRSKKGGAS